VKAVFGAKITFRRGLAEISPTPGSLVGVARHPSPECRQALEDRSSPAIRLENAISAGVPKSPKERLTGG
jgi:hypothetical protein